MIRAKRKAGLRSPILSFRERASVWGQCDTLHVLVHDRNGVEWVPTVAGYDLEACISDLADDQYPDAVAVYRSRDGRFEDVSRDVAEHLLQHLLRLSRIENNGLPRLIALHAPGSAASAEEHLSDANRPRKTRTVRRRMAQSLAV